MFRIENTYDNLPESFPVDWKCDEFQPGQIAQVKHIGNCAIYGVSDGTVDGTPGYAAEIIDGDAFVFDGSNFITTADTPFDFDFDDQFSISTWLTTSAFGDTDVIFAKLSGGKMYNYS